MHCVCCSVRLLIVTFASIMRGKGAAQSLDLGEGGQAIHAHPTEKGAALCACCHAVYSMQCIYSLGTMWAVCRGTACWLTARASTAWAHL